MAKDDELKQFLARAATGVQTTPEDAKRVLLAAGVSEEEFADLASTASSNTIEWQAPNTRMTRLPAVAPESLVASEKQGFEDAEKIVAAPETSGTDSNDPGVNLMATGPASEVVGVGFSGQVAGKGEPAGDKATKATAKASK